MLTYIYCEGDSDKALIQYLLERISDFERQKSNTSDKSITTLKHSTNDNCIVNIVNMNGISNLQNNFEKYLKLIQASGENEYKSIIIMDNDSEDEVSTNVLRLKKMIVNTQFKGKIDNDCLEVGKWNNISFVNNFAYNNVSLLKLYIIKLPMNRVGALELFLLDNLKEQDKNSENKDITKIIDDCEKFIDEIKVSQSCINKGYLSNRGDSIKAKFNVYFSVTTPNQAFSQRQNILKSIEWEKFDLINTTFECFKQLEEF